MGDNLHDDPLLANTPVVKGHKYLAPCFLYDRLGSGGMGTVYRGRHVNLDIDVAVKCLNHSLAQQDQKFVTRFQREARLAASIDQENLIRVYDVGSQNDVHYIVMELVRGETARERVTRKGPLPEREALAILLGAASALAAAHARGVVHRDIKPDNIMISVDGRVKVADLGLAKPLIDNATQTHGVMGTPKYMAPEQWTDPDLVGPWTDVWAVGATFFFLVTGRDPFRGASAGQAFPNVRSARRGLTRAAVALLSKCVSADRGQRFADASALLQQLRTLRGADIGTELADPGAEPSTVPENLVSPPPYRRTPLITPKPAEEKSRPPNGSHSDATQATVLTPQNSAVTVPGKRARDWRQGIWLLAAGSVLLVGVAWLVFGGPPRGPTAIAACESALAAGDLDRAIRLWNNLSASDGKSLCAPLAGGLTERAEQRRQARNFSGALADLRQAKLMAPGPAVDTAHTQVVEAVRASLRADTRLSLSNGSVVGRRSDLGVSGPDGLVRCTVQGRTFAIAGGTGTCALEFDVDGPVQVVVQLEHEGGVTEAVVLSFVGDVSSPTLTCAEPSEGAILRSPIAMNGTFRDASETKVRVGDRAAKVKDGRWELSVPVELPEGAHTLTIDAVDAVGNPSVPIQLAVVVDNTKPRLEVETLPQETGNASVDVVGKTEPGTSVTVNGKDATVEVDGRFRSRVPLPAAGRHEVTVLATDSAGNVSPERYEITRLPAITILEPAPNEATWHAVVLLKGRVQPAVRSLTIGGVEVPPDDAGHFSYAGQFPRGDLELIATVADGTQSKATLELRLPRDLPLAVDPPSVSATAEVRVRGSTEPDARVRIGDRVVTAGADGRFEVLVTLPGPGIHELTVSAWRADAPGHLGVELPTAFAAPARVKTVQANTAAAFVGVRPDDEIEAIDGRLTDTQGLLTAVAKLAAGVLTVRVRRGSERLDLRVTPWPAAAATARIRAEVAATAPVPDGIVPVFGIEPGVTSREQVKRLGTPVDSGMLTFNVEGHVVYCDEQVARYVVLAGSQLPPNWLRLGLKWASTEQESEALVLKNGWKVIEKVEAEESRDGVLEFQVRQGLHVILIFLVDKGLTRAEIRLLK